LSPPSRLVSRRLSGSLRLAAALLLGAGSAAAQTAPAATAEIARAAAPPAPVQVVTRDAGGDLTVRALPLEAPLLINGRLDDEVYRSVPSIGDFIQQEPREGTPATEKTEVWIFFDANNLYVTARCWDSQPDRIVASEMRRDNRTIMDGDTFTVVLDTFHDRRNGFYFQTNALGALRDEQITDERNPNPDWNAVWDTRGTRDDQGWTVEMVIPFKSLRYAGGGAQTWGVNFRRIIRSKNEISYLSPVPASWGGRGVFKFSSAATLVGIDLPAQTRNVELKPYAKSGLLTNRAAEPAISNDPTGDVGIDAKLGLTKGLTADFTVNTDFAQVEEDEQQVNLTRFSVLFPEKRDFFLEGQGIFAFGGVNARSGPGGGGSAGRIGDNMAAPPLAPIMFFSRRIGIHNGVEVPITGGARVTGRAGPYSVGLLNIQTEASDEVGAASTNFSVVRLKRDVLSRGSIGVLGTYRPQLASGVDGANQLYGVDTSLAFFENLTINSYYAVTRTPGIAADDASYLAKIDYAGDRYGANYEHLLVGEGFRPEIGFMRRSSFRRNFGQARFSPRPQGSRHIRKYIWEGSIDYITDRAGQLETRETQGSFRLDLNNGDQWESAFSNFYELLPESFEIATGVVVPAGGYDYNEYRGTLYFAPHRPVSGRATWLVGTLYGGDHQSAGFNARVDLGPRIGIEPRISFDWVDLPVGRFTSTLVSTRFGVTMSPRMAVTTLVQYTSASNALTSNIRFRWEYQAGSDLYVVYNDGRDTTRSGFPTLQNRSFVIKATRLLRW
jgi:hypothetical protein